MLVDILPGHGCWLHVAFIQLIPPQSYPPCCGSGNVQLRVRVHTPPSHDAVQVLHGPHGDQPPLTERKKNRIVFYMSVHSISKLKFKIPKFGKGIRQRNYQFFTQICGKKSKYEIVLLTSCVYQYTDYFLQIFVIISITNALVISILIV